MRNFLAFAASIGALLNLPPSRRRMFPKPTATPPRPRPPAQAKAYDAERIKKAKVRREARAERRAKQSAFDRERFIAGRLARFQK